MTFTIKGGTGYDVPWIVFDGPVDGWRADMLHVFGITEETQLTTTTGVVKVGALSLAALGMALSKLFQSMNGDSNKHSAWRKPAGTPTKGSEDQPQGGVPAAATEPSRASATPSPDRDAEAVAELAGLISGADSLDALKALLKEHKGTIQNTPTLKAAFAARGKTFTK